MIIETGDGHAAGETLVIKRYPLAPLGNQDQSYLLLGQVFRQEILIRLGHAGKDRRLGGRGDIGGLNDEPVFLSRQEGMDLFEKGRLDFLQI